MKVHLAYPDKLHDMCYPLGAEKVLIGKSLFLIYCEEIVNKYEISSSKVKKIILMLSLIKNMFFTVETYSHICSFE